MPRLYSNPNARFRTAQTHRVLSGPRVRLMSSEEYESLKIRAKRARAQAKRAATIRRMQLVAFHA